MSYDNRLHIKQHYEFNNTSRVNSIRFVENVDFVQVWLKNGDAKSTSIRLDRVMIGQIKEYLEKVEIKS